MTTSPIRLLVIGGGTAGTMVANKVHKVLPEWEVTLVDRDDVHDYQPGYLFMPFGMTGPEQVRRSTRRFIAPATRIVTGEVELIDAAGRRVELQDGTALDYDHLVIASGTTPRPDQTPGMLGDGWHRSVNEFYTYDGSLALRDNLAAFEGGRLVVHITELPIKCPVAPLEFTFLADDWLRQQGLREVTELVFVTPLDGAFTKPVASRELGRALEERDIRVETDFMVESVDQDAKVLRSYDEREAPYDLLVTVPLNMGADFVGRSGLGDELNYVTVDKHTMQYVPQAGRDPHPEVFALGDAANLPTSKAGSVAHFSVDVFVDNLVELAHGRPMTHSFDGHANCFVESGHGKALLLDFNYETEPLTGTFPFPGVGPLQLLKESRLNHLSKLAFRHIYWNALLPGRPLGLASQMSMAGKHTETPRDRWVDITARGLTAMPTTTIAGRSIEVNEEGFLVRPDEWTEDLGTELARLVGIEMTDAHWAPIRFLRTDFAAMGETATLRRVSTQTGIDVKSLFGLFPKKPAKKMAYVAGLPKPKGCV